MRAPSLNEEAFSFLIDFEKNLPDDVLLTTAEITEKFKKSIFYHEKFTNYTPTAVDKSIWFALKRSDNWKVEKRELYRKLRTSLDKISFHPIKENSTTSFYREKFINHLSMNLFRVLLLKRDISDDFLKKHHLSSKGIGDDLYYLTESYFRSKGLFKGKHSMSDFISIEAIEAIKRGDISGNLKFEHMIPKNIYIKQISEATLSGKITEEFISHLLNKYYYVCTVTKYENNLLHATKMDNDWDEVNPFLRYERAGIVFVSNR